MLTCSSRPSEPWSWAASGILVLVFAGLRVVDTSHAAAGSWEGHSRVGFPFQPVAFIGEEILSVCLGEILVCPWSSRSL